MELVEKVKADQHFEVREESGFTHLDYLLVPLSEDYQFPAIHRDLFWISKRKDIIAHVLPVIAGWLAICALLYKIASLL